MREKQSILNEMKTKPDSNCRAGSEVEIKRILATIFNAKKGNLAILFPIY